MINIELKYAVFSGSEKLDYGTKRPEALVSSREQAAYMAKFWGEFGYYEPIEPLTLEYNVPGN